MIKIIFFNTTATRATGKGPVKMSDIYRSITSLPESNSAEQFKLQTTNSDEVLKIIKSLRNDCLAGYDSFLIFLIKLVVHTSYHFQSLSSTTKY